MNKNDFSKVEYIGSVDVYSENFETEFRNIEKTLDAGYNVIGLDTEYPGVLYKQKYNERTAISVYNTMKANVDKLKPIQVGISLSDSNGDRPSSTYTWQFNLKFDPQVDYYDKKSIEMLKNAKIPFDILLKNGIEHNNFRDKFKKSCLFGNLKISWLSFHGAYDFAYLIKLLTCEPLPESLKEFNEMRKTICPLIYDVKMLIQANDTLRNYSLFKLANIYKIETPGTLHQAGTDAYLTSELFFRIKECLLDHKIKKFENKLFGLSKLFSANSLEFEARNNKQSLAERIQVIKNNKKQEEIYDVTYNIITDQMAYDMYTIPIYYNKYYGTNENIGYSYRME